MYTVEGKRIYMLLFKAPYTALHLISSCIPRESNPWPQRCERHDLLFEERLPSVDLRRRFWVRDVKYQRRLSSRWPADEEGQILIGHFTVCRFNEASGWNDGSLSLHLRSVAFMMNITIIQISHTVRSEEWLERRREENRLKRGNRQSEMRSSRDQEQHLGCMSNYHGNRSISLCIMGCIVSLKALL